MGQEDRWGTRRTLSSQPPSWCGGRTSCRGVDTGHCPEKCHIDDSQATQVGRHVEAASGPPSRVRVPGGNPRKGKLSGAQRSRSAGKPLSLTVTLVWRTVLRRSVAALSASFPGDRQKQVVLRLCRTWATAGEGAVARVFRSHAAGLRGLFHLVTSGLF